MIYFFLRHYGFQSFLLDWTKSSWIALYFAFEPANGGEYRAIYVHKEKKYEKKNDSKSYYHIETIEGVAMKAVTEFNSAGYHVPMKM